MRENSDEVLISEITATIIENHNKILDDWCKVYMAQRYKEGKSIKPGSFVLVQQQLPAYSLEFGYRYWFEDTIEGEKNE